MTPESRAPDPHPIPFSHVLEEELNSIRGRRCGASPESPIASEPYPSPVFAGDSRVVRLAAVETKAREQALAMDLVGLALSGGAPGARLLGWVCCRG